MLASKLATLATDIISWYVGIVLHNNYHGYD